MGHREDPTSVEGNRENQVGSSNQLDLGRHHFSSYHQSARISEAILLASHTFQRWRTALWSSGHECLLRQRSQVVNLSTRRIVTVCSNNCVDHELLLATPHCVVQASWTRHHVVEWSVACVVYERKTQSELNYMLAVWCICFSAW